MAVPTIVAGSALSGTGSVTLVPPSHQADDWLYLIAETGLGEAVPAISGYADVPGSPVDQGTNTRLTVREHFCDSSAEGDVVTGDPGNHILGLIVRVRGADTVTPIDVTATDSLSTASTAISIPGDTTTVDECLILALATSQLQTTASGQANSDLTSVAELFDVNTASGNDGSIWGVTGEKASAGSYGATTGTFASSSQQARMSIAFKPPASGTAHTVEPADSVTMSDALTFERGLGIADAATVSDALTFDRSIVVSDTLTLSDAIAFAREILVDDSIALSDDIQTVLGVLHQVNVDDSVTMSDALSFVRDLAVSDSISMTDALAFERGIQIADDLVMADAFAQSIGMTIADVLNVTDNIDIDFSGAPPAVNRLRRTLLGIGS